MASKSGWETAAIVVAILLLVFWIAVFLKTLKKAYVHVTSKRVVLNLLALVKKRDTQSAADANPSLMVGKIMQKRLSNAGTVNSCILFCANLLLLTNGLASFQGRRIFDTETQVVHDVCVFSISCAAFISHFFPCITNTRSLHIFHSGFFMSVLLVAAFMAKNLPAEQYMFFSTCLLVGRLAFGLYYSAWAPALFWNVVYSISISSIQAGKNSYYTDKFGGHAFYFLEFIDCALIIALTRMFEQLQVSGVCREIEAQSSLRSKDTAERLLSAMCDAVVNLGPHQEISSPCPKLDVLLLRHETTKEFESKSLVAVIHESDRARFTTFVESVSSSASNDKEDAREASSMHLHLCDVNGGTVPVQIFMVSYYDSLDRLCYIVGIKEDAEVPPMTGTFASVNADSGIGMSRCIPENAPREHFLASDAVDVAPSSASSGTLESMSEIGVDAWLVIDAFSFSVIEAAPEFVYIAGPSVIGADLRDWIPQEKIAAFRGFVQDMVNVHLSNKGSPPDSPQELVFGRMKFMPLEGVQCHATWVVTILHGEEEEEEEEEDVVSMHVALCELKVRTCRRSRCPRRSVGTRGRSTRGNLSLTMAL